MPTVRLPEALRRYSGGDAALEVTAATVGEALEAAFLRHPDLRLRLVDETGLVRSHLAVFRNGEQLRREEATAMTLAAGDTLTFLEAVGGGRG